MDESLHRNIRNQFEKSAQRSSETSEFEWEIFRTDASDYVKPPQRGINTSFAESFPDAERSIREDFGKRHERGEKVLVFDICGIADASSLGADHTACLALKPPPYLNVDLPQRTIFEGDIFRKDSLKPLLEFSEKYGARPSCIFFFPVGGLSAVPMPNLMQGAILLKQFKRLYQTLAPGGKIYLQVPPQLLIAIGEHGIMSASNVLKEAVGKSGVVEGGEKMSPFFRITKRDDEAEGTAK